MIRVIGTVLLILILAVGCGPNGGTTVSRSGVSSTVAEIEVGADGLTVEQRNIRQRLALENQPGSIKHLYIISAYSGDVLLYSTVDGKVTSSSKRLSPYTVATSTGNYDRGIVVEIDGKIYRTSEVLQDDGTYGSSVPYLYWFDVRGKYHQHYISGGQICHISDQPLQVGRVVINIEAQAQSESKSEAD